MLLVTIIGFVIILSILVLIHELGHFLTAKRLGIKVEEFGFGFPPRVIGIKRGETIYSINLLPVGGFVKLYGEDPAGGGSLKGKKNKFEKGSIKRAFFARPAWQRLIIVVAGVVMNFLLAVVIISYLFTAQGVSVPSENIEIVNVVENSPADRAGIRAGDEIISLNSERVIALDEFIEDTKGYLGEEVELTIKRDDKLLNFNLTPRENYPKDEGAFGIAITNVEVKKYPWYQAPFFGTIESFKFSFLIIEAIGTTIVDFAIDGTKPKGIAGPVGIAQITGQAISVGVNATLWTMALLSLNLAVLNILPIPALDGGRLFFILIELVTRRKVNPKYENLAHAVGLVVLLGLILTITYFDVTRIIAGKSLISP